MNQEAQVLELLLISVRALYRSDKVTPSVTCAFLGTDFYASVIRYQPEPGAPEKQVVCHFRYKTLLGALIGLSNKWLNESWYPNRQEMGALARLVQPKNKQAK